MKKIPILLAALLFMSCSASMPTGQYRGVGTRNTEGHPIGEWKLYHSSNSSLLAVGSFNNGNPVGEWKIYDSMHTYVADLNFKNGALDGRYKLFYTAFGYPNSKGRLKTLGSAKLGSLQGDFIRYAPDGSVVVDYACDGRQITTVRNGTKTEAENQIKADAVYLDIIFRCLASATK